MTAELPSDDVTQYLPSGNMFLRSDSSPSLAIPRSARADLHACLQSRLKQIKNIIKIRNIVFCQMRLNV